MATVPAWKKAYWADIAKYGPLPAGYEARHTQNDPQTVKYKAPNGLILTKHPMDPKDLHIPERDNAVPENPQCQIRVVGVAHPPYAFQAEWIWLPVANAESAAMFTLKNYGLIKAIADPAFQKRGREAFAAALKGQQPLYHPADRKTTIRFATEDGVSRLCRKYGRNLVIVSPEIKHDKSNWDAIYEPKPQDRPAMRARYSTGRQEDLPLVFVGCLPVKDEPVGGKAVWYILEPRSTSAIERFKSYNTQHVWGSTLLKEFGVNNSNVDFAQWLIVQAHRAILNSEISGEDRLGKFISQLGNYCLATKNRPQGERPDFSFNPGLGYNGKEVTFAELCIWLFTSHAFSPAKKYMKAWDNVMEAQDAGDWHAMRHSMTSIHFQGLL